MSRVPTNLCSCFVRFKIFLNCLCDVCYLFTFTRNHHIFLSKMNVTACNPKLVYFFLLNFKLSTELLDHYKMCLKALKTNKWDKNSLSLRVSLWGTKVLTFHFFPYTLFLIPSTQPCRESSLECGIEFSWFSGQCY